MYRTLYSKYSNERDSQFCIRTDILKNEFDVKVVRKYPTSPKANGHITNIFSIKNRFEKKFKETSLVLCPCSLIEGGIEFEYIDGICVKDIFLNAIKRDDYSTCRRIMKRFLECLFEISERKVWKSTTDFERVFGTFDMDGVEMETCSPAIVDMIFDNLVERDGRWVVLDYEWSFDFPIPTLFIAYRTVFYLLYNSPYLESLQRLGLYSMLGISDELQIKFREMEKSFQEYVTGDMHSVKELWKEGIDVKKLFQREEKDSLEEITKVYWSDCMSFEEEKCDLYGNSRGKHSISLLKYKDSYVRLDPGEMPGIMKIGKTNGLKLTLCNGFFLNSRELFFFGRDPWLIFSKNEDNATIEYEWIEIPISVAMECRKLVQGHMHAEDVIDEESCN